MRRIDGTRIVGLVFAIIAAIALNACAGITWDVPPSEAQSVNALMQRHGGDDFHLVLIHGIRTSDRTTWEKFRQLLCAHLADPCVSGPSARITERLTLAPHAPDANFLGHPVWSTDMQWERSQPFVDHYVWRLQSGRRLVVDEINWWPLAFAFKCQFIVGSDTALTGAGDSTNIDNCAENDDTHFPWFSADEEQSLKNKMPISGGAPRLNGALKTEILDWGISDAVLALGTSKTLLRETVRCAFSDVANFEQRVPAAGAAAASAVQQSDYPCGAQQTSGPPQGPSKVHFVIISHSLGAFLLLDTFAAAAADAKLAPQPGDRCQTRTTASLSELRSAESSGTSPALSAQKSQSLCFVLNNSDYLYFFANQFALLESGRVQGIANGNGSPASTSTECTNALSLWAGCTTYASKQIVAFSDPGDLLTFQVPPIQGVRVINVYTHNATDWLGLFESPASAHGKYLTSDSILKIVFGR